MTWVNMTWAVVITVSIIGYILRQENIDVDPSFRSSFTNTFHTAVTQKFLSDAHVLSVILWMEEKWKGKKSAYSFISFFLQEQMLKHMLSWTYIYYVDKFLDSIRTK